MDVWSIRKTVVVEAPAGAVWPWISDPALVSRWWCPPPTVSLHWEPREGGSFEERYQSPDFSYRVLGTVTEWSPQRGVAFQRVTDSRAGHQDVISIALHPRGGSTEVILEHAFPDLPEGEEGPAEAYYSDPWEDSLRRLARLVTGNGSGD